MIDTKRVAARHMKKADALGDIEQKLRDVGQIASGIKANLKLVDDLVAAGERRRVGRVSDINVGVMSFDGSKVTAIVAGTTGKYNVRITVAPKRGHNCTCPDWEKNGRQVGPCKHVLALGLAWKNEKLIPEINSIADKLAEIIGAPF